MPAVPRRVDDDARARVPRAATQPVHAPGDEVQRGTDPDHGPQHARQGLALVPVVQVPALAVVVGQARRCRVLGQERVEGVGAPVRRSGVDDDEPAVDPTKKRKAVEAENVCYIISVLPLQPA